MEKIFNKIMIVDGSYLLHRQLHLPSVFEIKGTNGERAGGVFGFLRSLNKEVCSSKFFPIVVFDHGISHRRVLADQYYKNSEDKNTDITLLTEEQVDDDYVAQYRMQRSKLVDILRYFGIPALMFDGWEGDDLIYVLSEISCECVILTDDRDMLQLLSKTCSVKRPMANEYWTYDEFIKSENITDTFDFVIMKAITGDNSDNIPSSCKGVGKKYANSLAKLLRMYCVNRYENDWSKIINYPNDESSMKSVCESLGIPYRKSYLNLDKSRFIRNMELVDLKLVDNYDKIIDSISSKVLNSDSHTSIFKLMASANSLGISDIPIDTLITYVSVRRKNLRVD